MKKHERVEVGGVVYTLEAQLGQGGAAAVWRARSGSDGQACALKWIRKDTRRASRNERFRKEIAYGLQESHPNIIKIYAHAEDDAAFYYVMDLYSATIQDIIGSEFDYAILLEYAIQLCEALAHVHGDDIVHRDVKPQNILIDTADRRLVLADFGIARFKDSTITKQGELLANRNYLAPEQMARNDPDSIGKPSDVFSAGLVIAEIFTKQNSRGAGHRRVRDLYPFLSDVDLLVERMMLQDENQRISIQAARDSLLVVRGQMRDMLNDISYELRPSESVRTRYSRDQQAALGKATRDVLSAKYIFERATDEELALFDPNYHCEISFKVSPWLFNLCVQAEIYSMSKRKFEYESDGTWGAADTLALSSSEKTRLQVEFETILNAYRIPSESLWSGLPRRSAQLFRFLKDYHCEELLQDILETISSRRDGSLWSNLMDAPVLWLVRSLRQYLQTDYLDLDQFAREQLEIEKQVSVLWADSLPLDPVRVATGSNLFVEVTDADEVAELLDALEQRWNVSIGERVDKRFSVHFRSRAEYENFRAEALRVASPYYAFEGDVLDLLRPEADHDDLVALVWDRDYGVRNTLAKVLGKRTITESRRAVELAPDSKPPDD
nr:serine/threonine-protein kinase [uncultured Microbacterium sp.]